MPGFGGAKPLGKILTEGWRRQIWGGGRQVVRVEFRGGRGGLLASGSPSLRLWGSVGWTLEAFVFYRSRPTATSAAKCRRDSPLGAAGAASGLADEVSARAAAGVAWHPRCVEDKALEAGKDALPGER